MMKVAIQGVAGCFHDIAAHQYFEREAISLVECRTFEQVFAAIADDSDSVALVAIENTIAGSLLHNYELLRESHLTIVGEHKLRIRHSLCCLPSDNWADIQEVNSHPVALAQCHAFLERHDMMKVVETDDTAGAAALIARHQRHGHAAICHRDAALHYGLKVLEEGIETNKHNFTRFLVVADTRRAATLVDLTRVNRSSLVFSLPHEEGSLSAILSVLSFYKLNLTKIQSLPIIGREWEYLFYIDLSYTDYRRYRQALAAITPLTNELQLLGEYENGKQTI